MVAGQGLDGADGGVGGNATITNALSGSTSGSLTLTQTSTGGNGGAVTDGGTAGNGGNANATLAGANTGGGSLTATATVNAGNGGSATNSGTALDIDGSVVSLVASVGSLSFDGTAWTWEYVAGDGPQSRLVSVLAIDNDPQGHASLALGFTERDFSLSSFDLYLTSDILVDDARVDVSPRLDLVPAGIELSAVEAKLAGVLRRQHCAVHVDSLVGSIEVLLPRFFGHQHRCGEFPARMDAPHHAALFRQQHIVHD